MQAVAIISVATYSVLNTMTLVVSSCVMVQHQHQLQSRVNPRTSLASQHDTAHVRCYDATAANPYLPLVGPSAAKFAAMMPLRRHRSSPSHDGSTQCSSATHFISDSLTPVLILREAVDGFIFSLLLSALEDFFDSTAPEY